MQSLLEKMNNNVKTFIEICLSISLLAVAGCGAIGGGEQLPSAQFVTSNEGPGPQYVVGPLDSLEIFVWRFPELSRGVLVRPDGRFSMPLIDDIAATGRTPTQLARDIEEQLTQYVQSPIVTVIVGGFQGPFAQQVRVVGSAAAPQATQMDELYVRGYKDQHPDMIILQNQINSLEEKLVEEKEQLAVAMNNGDTAALSSMDGLRPNPLFDQLSIKLLDVEGEIAKLEARIIQKNSVVNNLLSLSKRVPEVEAEGGVLHFLYLLR